MDTRVISPTDVEIKKGSLLYKLPLLFLAAGIGMLVYWAVYFSADHARSMFSYLFGFMSVLSLALGCLIFVLIQHVTRAGWSVVVRRISEVAIAIMPLFIILFIPIALFSHDLFPWMHADHLDDILLKKQGFLNERFFLMRSFFYLLVWAVMGVWFYRVSAAQDGGNRFELTKSLQAVSAPCIYIFALTATFAAIDWMMSLEPHWYSTIFGVYFFAGCILFALAFVTLMSLVLQRAGVLRTVITGDHYHDLGKLMFGFTVFWAYIAFSQFVLIWYGSIPEEVEFYSQRLHQNFAYLSWAMPITHFFVPFFALMSRVLKRVKLILAINCVWIMVVHLIDLYWLIMPCYQDPHSAEGQTIFHFAMPDLLACLGLASVYFGCFLFVLSKRKVLAVGDPRLKESLAFENF